MRGIFKYIAVAALLLAISDASARDVYSLNRGWTFFTGKTAFVEQGVSVNLPHTWNSDAISGTGDYYRGVGNYSRTLDVPADWSARRLYLRVLGANSVADVFVNGRYVGEHRGGSSAFTFEITDFVQFGKSNTLLILVNNAPRLDVLPTAGEANSYGGLFRGVDLIVSDRYAISPLYNGSDGAMVIQKKVTQARVEGEVEVALTEGAKIPSQSRVSIKVYNAGDTLITDNIVDIDANNESLVKVPFVIENPTLWNGTLNPYLYSIDVKLTAGERVVDSLDVVTGFRSYAIDAQRGFLLNGKPYRLRGAVLHRDRMMAGSAVTPLQIEEDFRILTDMGANAVRVAGGQHSDYFYTLCDQSGIIVWSDLPFIGQSYFTDCGYVNNDVFRQNGIDQLTETITQLFNHPSVAFWGLFANLDYRGDNPTSYVKELNCKAKALDPSRLTAAVSNQDGELNFITDAIVFDHSFGWTSGSPDDIGIWAERFHKQWNKLCAGVSYAAGGSIYQQDGKLERPKVDGSWHPEGWQTYFHERYLDKIGTDSLFFGIFVEDLFDYGAVRRTWGDGKGLNDCGLVTFDRKECKDAYYIYKARWNDDKPFVYIVGRRYDSRQGRFQNIKVYSNQAEVEFVLNGKPVSTKTSENGVFLWTNVEMRAGINRIEVRSGWATDNASIFIEGEGATTASSRAPQRKASL